MYFVPLLDASRAYLLPSNDLIEWIVLPSLVAVAAGALLLLSISPVLRWINPRIAIGAEAIGLTILAITAVKVLFLAAGYRWEQLIPTGGYVPLGLSLYLCKYGFCFGILAVMWAGRGHLRRWTRLLSGLGLSLGVLAAIRIFFLWNTHQPTPEPSTGMATPKPSATSPVPAGTHVRRVVWVIFDESDYNRMLMRGLRSLALSRRAAEPLPCSVSIIPTASFSHCKGATAFRGRRWAVGHPHCGAMRPSSSRTWLAQLTLARSPKISFDFCPNTWHVTTR
jgi:hypothetical protein